MRDAQDVQTRTRQSRCSLGDLAVLKAWLKISRRISGGSLSVNDEASPTFWEGRAESSAICRSIAWRLGT